MLPARCTLVLLCRSGDGLSRRCSVLPMHDVRLPMDIGVHELLKISLAGIGPNGEVHILSLTSKLSSSNSPWS